MFPRPAELAAAAVAGSSAGLWWSPPLGVFVAIAGAGLVGTRRGGLARWAAVTLIFGLAGGWATLRAGAAPEPPASWGANDTQADLLHGRVTGLALDSPRGRSVLLSTDAGPTLELIIDQPAPAVADGDELTVRARVRSVATLASPGARPLPRRRAPFTAHVRADQLTVTSPSGFSLLRWATELQRRASARLWSGDPDDERGALLAAMAVGDRSGLEFALRQPFADSGVAHVLAVSGLHVGLIAWLLFGWLRKGLLLVGPLARRCDVDCLAAPLAGAAAVGFALITGARVSTVRAVVVAVLVLAGVALARRVRVLDALGVVAIALIALDPAVVADVSFQLSFAAATVLTLALARREQTLSLQPSSWWSRRLGFLATLLRASLWAQLATLPLTAWWFGEVAFAGVIANLSVVPLVEVVIVPFALIGVLLTGLSAPLAAVFLAVARLGVGWTKDTADAFAALLPPLRVGVVSTLEVLVAGGLVLACVAAARGRLALRRLGVLTMAAVLAGLGASWFAPIALPEAAAPLVIEFIDVGQGDAALISLPNGRHWLIDAGGLPYVAPRPGEAAAQRRARASLPARQSVLPLLELRGVRRLEVLVLSHPHPDHYGGLEALLGAVEIGEIWLPGAAAGEAAAAAAGPRAAPPGDGHGSAGDLVALLQAHAARGSKVRTPRLGRHRLGPSLWVEVLAPRYAAASAKADPVLSVNDNSLVLRLERAGTRLLFPGDLEAEGEERLIADGEARADIVKVPHHGSATSSTAAFVAATSARLVVISCATGNSFGFPAPAVVARWAAAGARVLRTDHHGTVRVEIDPRGAVSYLPTRRLR